MSTILLAFEPDWFDKLSTGEKKFEYRKHFPKGNTTVFFYVSNPVKAITGIAEFAERESLNDWKEKYAERPVDVMERINDFATDCRWAMPMVKFQPTNKITLEQIREAFPDFIVPRMYYYIDNSYLLKYLESNLIPQGQPLNHSFDLINDDDIC